MELGFDAKRAFHNATGLGNYARDVLRALHLHAPGHRLHAYTPPPARTPPGLEEVTVSVHLPTGPVGRLLPSLWRSRGVVRDLERDRIDVFHGLSAELPAGIERTAIAPVVTIHDLIFERRPDLYSPIDRAIYRWKARSAVARARRVVAVSEETARDLAERYAVPRERIRVVYQTCQPIFRTPIAGEALAEVARRLALPPRFVLAVGTVERRKNLGVVVRALAGLPGETLVAVGRPTAYQDEVRALAARLGVADRVRFLSGVAAGDLAALYRLATVSVYPSLLEGFGIPIVEALASGTPVVTTRGGCFEEAGGPGTAYVDPTDEEEVRATLAAVLGDEARRRRMVEAGHAHARRFAHDQLAHGLVAVYREAAGERAG